MKLSDFNYELPRHFIAKYPCEKRDESKLFVIHRNTGKVEHRVFKDIINYFSDGDVLVINKTKVIQARLIGKKETGGKIEVLVLESNVCGDTTAIVKPLKNLKIGSRIFFGEDFCKVIGIENGMAKLNFFNKIDIILKKHGKVPLPPYIKREPVISDTERYQTVYANVCGSVAAPTAGLHFTDELIEKLKNKNVKFADVLLHISWATFAPVRCHDIKTHKMGTEYFEIEKTSADIINSAKRKIAIGTTSVRVIESATSDKKIVPQNGSTDIFIYPGYEFKNVDALLTNFHLPQTTLFMLVCAFAGRDLILNIYEEAKRNNYRFASYGDAMLLL